MAGPANKRLFKSRPTIYQSIFKWTHFLHSILAKWLTQEESRNCTRDWKQRQKQSELVLPMVFEHTNRHRERKIEWKKTQVHKQILNTTQIGHRQPEPVIVSKEL